MERSYVSDVLKKKEGKVLVKGWVSDIRDLGKIRFLLLRDMAGIIQITCHKDKCKKEVFDLMKDVSRERVLEVEGKAVKSKQAPGGVEIIPEKILILAEAESPLPIDVSDFSKTEISKRLDYRFLDFHRRKVQAIFKIQGEIANSFREFFYKKGFVEIQTPSIISSASEGGTELFPVQYFEKKAFLAQSPQLYKQMLACSLEKVFMITPVWRAEKHNTTRHLNESRQMDIEMAFSGQKEVMLQLEEVVKYIVEKVIEKCEKELALLEVKLKIPKAVYLSYEEAIKKVKGKFGDDFSPEQEKRLCELYPDSIIFTYDWPSALKPFYIMPKPQNFSQKVQNFGSRKSECREDFLGDEKENAELSEGFDALYKGMEISSGGQRVHIPELLIARLKAKKLNPGNFKSYVDSFRFGSPTHSGWSIGLERFTQALLGLDNIREACLFPRDRDRLTP